MNDTFRWIVNLSFKTAAMTSVFAITSAILAIACFKFNSTNVYLAFAYPLPAICESDSDTDVRAVYR